MSEAKAGERFEMLGGNIQGEFVEVRTIGVDQLTAVSQGDTSRCSLGSVDIKSQVEF